MGKKRTCLTTEEKLGLIVHGLEHKKINKAMAKQPKIEQTQCGMACATKSEVYLPPTRPNRKPKL